MKRLIFVLAALLAFGSLAGSHAVSRAQTDDALPPTVSTTSITVSQQGGMAVILQDEASRYMTFRVYATYRSGVVVSLGFYQETSLQGLLQHNPTATFPWQTIAQAPPTNGSAALTGIAVQAQWRDYEPVPHNVAMPELVLPAGANTAVFVTYSGRS